MITKSELKLWKKYRESVDKLNVVIQQENSEKLTNPPRSNVPGRTGVMPELRSYIVPSIVGFYDFISGYTKKEVKK